MQLGINESVNLFSEIQKNIPEKNNSNIVICPSFVSLNEINKIKNNKIKLGGQDVFWEEVGAYTGEISCKMLVEAGAQYVILGHSDRRKYFNETDEIVHYKAKTSLACSMTPVICVGESLLDRKEGRKDHVVISQVTKAISGIDIKGDENVVIAYEPVWVIGSGEAIDASEAEYMHQVIKRTLIDLFSVSVVEKNFKIIYGGSINNDVVVDFLTQPTVDGVLIGGASLKLNEFIGIINKTNEI